MNLRNKLPEEILLEKIKNNLEDIKKETDYVQKEMGYQYDVIDFVKVQLGLRLDRTINVKPNVLADLQDKLLDVIEDIDRKLSFLVQGYEGYAAGAYEYIKNQLAAIQRLISQSMMINTGSDINLHAIVNANTNLNNTIENLQSLINEKVKNENIIEENNSIALQEVFVTVAKLLGDGRGGDDKKGAINNLYADNLKDIVNTLSDDFQKLEVLERLFEKVEADREKLYTHTSSLRVSLSGKYTGTQMMHIDLIKQVYNQICHNIIRDNSGENFSDANLCRLENVVKGSDLVLFHKNIVKRESPIRSRTGSLKTINEAITEARKANLSYTQNEENQYGK